VRLSHILLNTVLLCVISDVRMYCVVWMMQDIALWQNLRDCYSKI